MNWAKLERKFAIEEGKEIMISRMAKWVVDAAARSLEKEEGLRKEDVENFKRISTWEARHVLKQRSFEELKKNYRECLVRHATNNWEV